MSETAEMTRYLRTHLDDWDSWRVFGDWLTDHGDIRGTIIGMAYRLATESLPVDERRAMVVERERLEREHARVGLSDYEALPGTAFTWRYGFVTGVTLPWTQETPQKLGQLLAHPTACLLTTAFLSGNNMGDNDLRAIAALENARLLHALHLGYNNFGDLGVRSLVEANGCAWTELHLNHNQIGPDGASAIAAAESCRTLLRLDLGYNRIGKGARALARSAHLGSLRALYLEGNALDARSRDALAHSEALRGCTIRT